jgi:multidrug resistance efflux pump
VLARIASDAVDSELAESRGNSFRSRGDTGRGASHQRARQATCAKRVSTARKQGIQSQTAADTALARLNAARARLASAELRRSKAAVMAPDDGIISARNATVGSLTQPGQELFRLIRGGRLEWRAEVTAAELSRLEPGNPVRLEGPNGVEVKGGSRRRTDRRPANA